MLDAEFEGGFDYVVNTATGDRLRSDMYPIADNNAAPFRAAAAGSRFATVGIDPAQGYMFGTGSSFGFGASLMQNAQASIDVQFAPIYPPTAVMATPATGGTLAAATYYATVTSTSDNCTHQSAMSVQSSGAVLAGANTAVTVSWAAPVTGTTPVAGYCVNISTTPSMTAAKYWAPAQTNAVFVSGGSTTTATPTRCLRLLVCCPMPRFSRQCTGLRRRGWASINSARNSAWM